MAFDHNGIFGEIHSLWPTIYTHWAFCENFQAHQVRLFQGVKKPIIEISFRKKGSLKHFMLGIKLVNHLYVTCPACHFPTRNFFHAGHVNYNNPQTFLCFQHGGKASFWIPKRPWVQRWIISFPGMSRVFFFFMPLKIIFQTRTSMRELQCPAYRKFPFLQNFVSLGPFYTRLGIDRYISCGR